MDGETYDYGLDPDESFIPDDLDSIDASLPHIMTVLGPIAPGALGATNASAAIGGFVADQRFSVREAFLTEIGEAGFVGIAAFVASDSIGLPEDLAPLRWVAERSNLHFIYGYSPPGGLSFDEEVAALIDVATNGLGESQSRPGFFAVSFDGLAAAMVAREAVGLPIVVAMTASEIDSLVTAAPDGLDGMIARIPEQTPLESLVSLAESGAFLLFEQVTGDPTLDQLLAETIAAVANAGYLESLLLGYSPTTVPESVSYGVGSRWSYLIEQFPLLVLEAGLDAPAVRSILIENPNEAFVTHPPLNS
ncbi:hypothetical protein BH09CHL1_BH09CHL1_01370 [soil metagenome]